MRPFPGDFSEAAFKLREKTRGELAQAIVLFRGFRKVEEHRLKMLHRAGAGGLETARQRSAMADALVSELFAAVVAAKAPKGLPEPLAVAACGGYARRELSPFSDIDLVFLHPRGKPGPKLEEVIRVMVAGLWDAGFKVGHAAHSLSGALAQANKDLVTKGSWLDARFLCGSRPLFAEFRERFFDECVRGREQEFIQWRIAGQAAQYEKYGISVFMQEPNVKHGKGGLRDWHHVLWLAAVRKHTTSPARLVELGILTDSERRAVERAYDFLLRVRTELQYLNGRAYDTLTLQMQGKVAAAFGYPQKHILRKVEAFMRDYYRHARTLHQITTTASSRLVPAMPKPALRLWPLPRASAERFDGFFTCDGKLFPVSSSIFAEDEFRMMRAFRHAQARRLEFSPELRELIRASLRLINRTFQYAKAGRETFLEILSHKGEVGKILREMHDLGFLGRYLPEFGALDCLVQHEFFHRYTADEHTLVCVEKLDGLLFSQEPRLGGYRALFQRLEDPATLYLAILLHDTGKALNTKHHEDASAMLAQKVSRRLQLPAARRRMLITLVNSHVELSLTAQRRNLDDPATISQMAEIVGTPATLDALMLLTLADGMATSGENWSDWKEGLVWTLYERTRDCLLSGGQAASFARRDAAVLRREVEQELGPGFSEEIAAHFELMPERYFPSREAAEIAGHIRLFHRFLENHLRDEEGALAPAFQWVARPDRGHSEVWVCGWDRPRLLERIAGAFLAANINILSADIFTRGDNLALDIFRVCTTDFEPVLREADCRKVEQRLAESLRYEDYDFGPFLGREPRLRTYRISSEAELPSRIAISNSSHPGYTLVDIQTPDRVGLLYDLLRAFGEAGVNIEFSRITTEKDVAIDSFYVTGEEGGKIEEPGRLARLQRLLKRACASAAAD